MGGLLGLLGLITEATPVKVLQCEHCPDGFHLNFTTPCGGDWVRVAVPPCLTSTFVSEQRDLSVWASLPAGDCFFTSLFGLATL